MAVGARSSCMLLALSTCVSLVLGGDCRTECALCVYRLQEQQSAVSTLACSLECDGELDSQRLRLCQDFLLEEEEDAGPHLPQEPEAAIPGDNLPASPEKYGFTKRYGGFMSRRSSSPEAVLDDPGDQEEKVRQEILKIISEGDGQGGEMVKRYGGFMRRADGEAAPGRLLEAVLGRGLRKRYGGFMRRVGRPEWLVDSRNGAILKRYGGFMD